MRAGGMGLAVLGLVCLLAHASPVAAEHEIKMDPSGFMQCAYDWAAEQDQLPYSSCSVACDQAGQACVDSAAVSAPVVSSLADGLIDACGSEAPGPFSKSGAEEFIWLYLVLEPISHSNSMCFDTWEGSGGPLAPTWTPTAFSCADALARYWSVNGLCYNGDGLCQRSNVPPPPCPGGGACLQASPRPTTLPSPLPPHHPARGLPCGQD